MSSDKRRTGSTSLREEGKPQQWGGGWLERQWWWVVDEIPGDSQGGWREDSFRGADPHLSESHGLALSACRYVITRLVAGRTNLCKSTVKHLVFMQSCIKMLLLGVLRLCRVYFLPVSIRSGCAEGHWQRHRRLTGDSAQCLEPDWSITLFTSSQ